MTCLNSQILGINIVVCLRNLLYLVAIDSSHLSLNNYSFYTVVFSQTPDDVLIAVGSQAQFTCSFSSTNAASVSWEKDGVTLLPSSRITINSTTLTINPTESEDSGTYSCIVTDQVNQVAETRSANLTFACKCRN